MTYRYSLFVPLAMILLAAAPARAAGSGDEQQSGSSGKTSTQGDQSSGGEDKSHPSTGRRIVEGTKQVGSDVGKGAEWVGTETVKGGKAVVHGVKNEAKDVDVRSALKSDGAIDTRHIDISTDSHKKLVTLRGTVPTHAQKDEAARVARESSHGYRVRDYLKVAPR